MNEIRSDNTSGDAKNVGVAPGPAPQSTTDYSIFKELPGNRDPNEPHVKMLVKSMVNNGNLTQQFPIVVNEAMEVVDGQHRLAALKELKWPVFYRIEHGLNIDSVRAINAAGANWSWKDYGFSYAKLGKEEYRKFMNLAKLFPFGFGVLSRYCSLGHKDNRRVGFIQGEFEFPNYDRSVRLLKQYQEISNILGHHTSKFGHAMWRVINSSEYDHDRMVRKAQQHEQVIENQALVEGYLHLIEQIYNFRMPEDSRVRLWA